MPQSAVKSSSNPFLLAQFQANNEKDTLRPQSAKPRKNKFEMRDPRFSGAHFFRPSSAYSQAGRTQSNSAQAPRQNPLQLIDMYCARQSDGKSNAVQKQKTSLIEKNNRLRKELEKLRRQREAKIKQRAFKLEQTPKKVNNNSNQSESIAAGAGIQAVRANTALHLNRVDITSSPASSTSSSVSSSRSLKVEKVEVNEKRREPPLVVKKVSKAPLSKPNASFNSKKLFSRPSSAHSQGINSRFRPTSAVPVPSSDKRYSSSREEAERPFVAAEKSKGSSNNSEREKIQNMVSNPTFAKGDPCLYSFGKILGQGSFGVVRAATHKITGLKVGVKVYDKVKFKDSHQLKRCRTEVKLLESLSHPNIVRLYEGFETSKKIFLVMENCGTGNLCTYVRSKKRLPELEARQIFFQTVSAVHCMHRQNIVHRDIKLENILFDGKIVKLCDMGFSTKVSADKKLRVFCGTPSYMPPEIVRRKEYEGFPVDIWSLGVLVYSCLAGRFPFAHKSYPELYKKIARGVYNPLPDTISNTTRETIDAMMTVNPSMRPTSAQLLKSLQADPNLVKIVKQQTKGEQVHYISKDPSEDINPVHMKQLTDFGFSRDALQESILARKRNHLTTTYYLLRLKSARKKKSRQQKHSHHP